MGAPASTDRLAAILAPAERLGIPMGDAFQRIAGPFPVAAEAWWTNDWHARRCEPYPHLHEGIDIFASAGSPLVATADARVTQKGGHHTAGLSVEITDEDGVQYFYAHLSGFADGLSVGQRVETGQVLGYVGTTGNARGTSPHLHLEIQPDGVPVPPKPYVDRWLAMAKQRAKMLVGRLRSGGQSAPSPESTREATDMGSTAIWVPTQSDVPRTAGSETASPSVPDFSIARGFAGATMGGVMGLALLLWSLRRRPGAPAFLDPALSLSAMGWGAQLSLLISSM
jgi:murein DD-endopeptidase MepM/ murein hydrolase activator NlpD